MAHSSITHLRKYFSSSFVDSKTVVDTFKYYSFSIAERTPWGKGPFWPTGSVYVNN